MKSTTTGTVSGCIIWVIVFGIIGMCVVPVAGMVGGLSSASGLAVRTVGPMVCPDNTTPEIYSYATTTTDDFGVSTPATAYEIHCLDASGENVKTDPVAYAFIWIGIIAAIGFVLTGILALVFAAPAGVLIARLFNRNKSINNAANIEPK